MKKLNKEQVFDLVKDGIKKAEQLHPQWPHDPLHASALISEEVGELSQACTDFCYPEDSNKRIRVTERDMMEEAIHVAVTAIRFIAHLHTYTKQNSYPLEQETNQKKCYCCEKLFSSPTGIIYEEFIVGKKKQYALCSSKCLATFILNKHSRLFNK